VTEPWEAGTGRDARLLREKASLGDGAAGPAAAKAVKAATRLMVKGMLTYVLGVEPIVERGVVEKVGSRPRSFFSERR